MRSVADFFPSGVYVPLVTPFYRGRFDARSLRKLIRDTEPHVDGYVPCLSSGEGQLLSDSVWEEVVRATRRATKKPVAAGIKRNNPKDVLRLAAQAHRIGCNAVLLPVPSSDEGIALRYFAEVGARIDLPIIIYNTEQNHLHTRSALRALSNNPAVIGIKDSSMNKRFFAEACAMRSSGALQFAVLQGMEHQMHVPEGCDGHMVALANVEPALCRDMLRRNSAKLGAKVVDCFWRYNLGGNWYVSLKAVLCERGVLRSAEETRLAIRPT
jgi:4-hydroxy-tetrahydrodipicolinate synthase